MKEFRAGEELDFRDNHPSSYKPSLFLAGSIEGGTAENWQAKAVDYFKSYNGAIFNPLRREWSKDVVQSWTDKQLMEQVVWEQTWLNHAQYVLVHFQADTKSPITLHELGQLCHLQGKEAVVVSCPREFWRSGNVQISCALYGMNLYEGLTDALAHIRVLLEHKRIA